MERTALLYFSTCLGAMLALVGCQPKIGDGCSVSTDCSIRGDRICDTSQPGGYCTVLQCLGHTKDRFDSPGACPQTATCVAVNPAVPGCAYDDRRSPGRTTRTLCLALCKQKTDCRPGYDCALVTDAPSSTNDLVFRGRSLDEGPSPRVCVPTPTMSTVMENPDAAVCSPNPPAYDAGATDADTDASTDASSDAGADAEGGSDAGTD